MTTSSSGARAGSPFQRGDHVELAQRLAAVLGEQGKTVHADGVTWQYSSERHVFEAVSAARLSQLIQGFAGRAIKNEKRPLSVRAADVSGVTKLAQDALDSPHFFGGAPPGIAFLRSFVEVRADGIVEHEHSPEHRARFVYGFDYQRDAQPRLLLEFFSQVFFEDMDSAEKVAAIQEYVGASMLGRATQFQRAMVALGEGANGKSALATIIERAMPPGSVVAIPPQDFGDEYRAAMLAGKLLNIVAELPEAEILDSESFKGAVTGDARTARQIRQAPFTFRPIAGHYLSANRLPGTTDQTRGFFRRFLIVCFNRTFPEHEQRPEVAEEIVEAELPAIVSWFLSGAQRVIAQGRYTAPPSSQTAVEDWRRNADQVRAFVDDKTERLPVDAAITDWFGADELYRCYRLWTVDNGHRPLASNKFGSRMALIGLASKHSRFGNLYPVARKREEGYA